MTHPIHDDLPSGFNFADRLQVAAFMKTGSMPGASKVCLVGRPPRLACRLRPPRSLGDTYISNYRAGWQSSEPSSVGDKAFNDGFRDRQEGRMKWHLAYCLDHGDHEEGCGA